MIKNISFTGIKNIGAVRFRRDNDSVSNSVSFVLTDDYNGKDLTEFKKITSKMTRNANEYRNPEYSDVVNIESIINRDGNAALCVNGTPLTLNYEDLYMFSFISKLMDRIAAMKKKDMVVNSTYKEFVAPETLVYGGRLEPNENNKKQNPFDEFFDFDKVKEASAFIGQFIEKIMYDFLDMN